MIKSNTYFVDRLTFPRIISLANSVNNHGHGEVSDDVGDRRDISISENSESAATLVVMLSLECEIQSDEKLFLFLCGAAILSLCLSQVSIPISSCNDAMLGIETLLPLFRKTQ